VLRLLDRGDRRIGLNELGMSPELRERFERIVARPHGIVLATGPTGSGKTTTLYAALGLRRPEEEKIVTVEDPVEYHLAGVTQVPVNAKAGFTWATALRSIVRQDFNVLLVGEMRDPETAAIATQAALTGHLVLSTLHTNDAASAIPRLMDLGVEPYLVASTLEAVLAQRLVRKICPHCRVRDRPDPQVVSLLTGGPVGQMDLTKGDGCDQCRKTGYHERTGIFELLVITDELRDLIATKPTVAQVREVARDAGMMSLREDGWIRVQGAITTVQEVLRVTDR
jgi:type II secretory ATPase GspE/PulE/Tfp pilus assembly ATPase PilB-like protein